MICNEYTQENLKINQPDRQKVTFHGSAIRKISQQCTPATHRSSTLPGGPLGGLPSLSLTIKGSWMQHLGGGRKASRQLCDASTPVRIQNAETKVALIKTTAAFRKSST